MIFTSCGLTVWQLVSLTPRCERRLWSCSAQVSVIWLPASHPASCCNCTDTSKQIKCVEVKFTVRNYLCVGSYCATTFTPLMQQIKMFWNKSSVWSVSCSLFFIVVQMHLPGCDKWRLPLIHLSLVSSQHWWTGSRRPSFSASLLSLSMYAPLTSLTPRQKLSSWDRRRASNRRDLDSWKTQTLMGVFDDGSFIEQNYWSYGIQCN